MPYYTFLYFTYNTAQHAWHQPAIWFTVTLLEPYWNALAASVFACFVMSCFVICQKRSSTCAWLLLPAFMYNICVHVCMWMCILCVLCLHVAGPWRLAWQSWIPCKSILQFVKHLYRLLVELHKAATVIWKQTFFFLTFAAFAGCSLG